MSQSTREASLFAAVDRGNLHAVRKLLSDGVSPNIRTDKGIVLLHAAVARNNPSVVAALLDAGANPNLRDHNGYSPIADAQSIEVARLLIHAGADLNVRCWNDLVPLDFFVRKKETAIVELFLHYGAQVPQPMRHARYWESLGDRCEPLRRIVFAHLMAGSLDNAMRGSDNPAAATSAPPGASPL